MRTLVEDPALSGRWHPAARSADVGTEPVPVTVLGVKLVLFRSSQGVHAFRDLCVHRGVPLSLGRVEGEELVCAYHGWRYDTCGACVWIPALPEGQAIPSKARTAAYGCMEREGLVWVCIGEPEAPEPELSGLIDRELLSILMGPYPVQASAPRVIENFLDVSHLMFVHEGLLGDSAHAEIGEYQMTSGADGILRSDEIEIYQPDPDGRGLGVTNRYIYEIISPLFVRLTKRTAGTDEVFHLFLMVNPDSETACTAYMLQLRNYAPEVPDQVFIDFQDRLLEQDKRIVENQKPELLPLDLQAELHLKCDRVSIAYRKYLLDAGVTFGTE
ncbi:aromatic ring-hydroxylating dioxygenase subunit alpha [Gorillibacterium sp. sgz5001074]|uniref:aromatic ring-hydroxylating dioxygenase subunit alpha n=1 Tax=Gorillibacterium sp. sgz5001074 TaxID=3446695 RepID=UPI003F67FC08